MTGRTKAVKAKLRQLRPEINNGVRYSATYTVGNALDDWLGGRSDRLTQQAIAEVQDVWRASGGGTNRGSRSRGCDCRVMHQITPLVRILRSAVHCDLSIGPRHRH